MKYFLNAGLLFLTLASLAQNVPNCQRNIDFLDNALKGLPVYKNTTSFKDYHKALGLAHVKEYESYPEFDCFQKMSKMLVSLNDRHNRIYSKPGYQVQGTDTVYKQFPQFKGDLDSLKLQLSTRSLSDSQGIYHVKDFSVGLVTINGLLTMINLTRDLKVWREGEILGNFYPYARNRYMAAMGLFHNKQLYTFPLQILDGRIHKLGLAKKAAGPDHSGVDSTKNYRYGRNGDLTYIGIGSFSGFNPVLQEAQDFYEELNGKNVTSKLILDLRNNGGGGNRNSNILYRYLRKNYKRAKLYVLVNSRTTSNAEQFVLRLKRFKNVKILGSQTSGTIAYELGKSYEFPYYNFTGFFTFRDDKKYLEYESVGIKPDVLLDNATNWIEQTKDYIAKEHR